MFDRPRSGECAVLVHVDFPGGASADALLEFAELVVSAGATPVATITASRHAPDAKLFVGSGKAEEIHQAVLAEKADVVIFNHRLSPSQERNLESVFSCRVLDRTGLILDIFAQRARSFEGKLQVELAQLQHMSTRLVRGWTHLERQKGGIGLRGPGETQLETDRRLLGARIKMIHKRLEKVRKQRAQGRRARARAEMPTLSLVGYTNAGKSTLFNAICDAEVYAADQMFATLDPTLRRIQLPGLGSVIVADTVGFVRDLPHDLVAAFRSTLEETCQASLLLHVVDAHDEDRQTRIEQVNEVLAEIDADEIPQLLVYNKIDLSDEAPQLQRNAEGQATRVWVSAATGAGLPLLLQAITEYFQVAVLHGWLHLPPVGGRLRARLHELGKVLTERVDEQGCWDIEIRAPREELERLFHKEQLEFCFTPIDDPGNNPDEAPTLVAGAQQAP